MSLVGNKDFCLYLKFFGENNAHTHGWSMACLNKIKKRKKNTNAMTRALHIHDDDGRM